MEVYYMHIANITMIPLCAIKYKTSKRNMPKLEFTDLGTNVNCLGEMLLSMNKNSYGQ
jgi:hypothetical protein